MSEYSHRPSDMEHGMCGFCRRTDVEDACGKLHMEKTAKDGWIAAHHRCMQYCALLVQYKFEHFGGFKIDKVLDEYRRGKQTKCFLCCTNKKLRKTSVVRGATAGCAVKSCRRTFHYYCAKMSDTTITKRLVVHIKSKGERTVLYRVFCSKEHELQYRQNLKKYLAAEGKKGSADCMSESDDNKRDEDSGDEGAELDDMMSQNTNSTLIHLSDLETSPLKRTPGRSDKKPSFRKRGHQEMSSSNDSHDDDSGDDDSEDMTSNPTQVSDDDVPLKKRKLDIVKKRKFDSEEEDDTDFEPSETRKTRRSSVIINGQEKNKRVSFSKAEGSSSDKSPSKSKAEKSESASVSNGAKSKLESSQLNKKKSAVKENGSDKEKKSGKQVSPISRELIIKVVKEKMGEDSPSNRAGGDWKTGSVQKKSKTDGKEKENASSSKKKSFDRCAVCIAGDPECSKKLDELLEKIVCKQCNIKPRHFFLWQNLDPPPLSKQNMVYFIKDLAKHFMDGNVTEVEKLLFEADYLARKDRTQYKLQGAFLQDLGNEIITKTQELVWSSIKAQFSNNDTGSVVKAEGKRNLVLILDDTGIDSDRKLRGRLGISEEESPMITWTPATVVTKTTDDDDQEMCVLEKDTILAWMEENIPSVSHVFVHPQEEILMPKWEGGSVADEIATHLQAMKKENKQTSSVLVFKQLDEEVVNVQAYARKAIQKVLPSCARTGSDLLVIMDIRSLTSKNIQQQLQGVFQDDEGNQLPVTLRSAFDPSSIPVSCVVVEVDTEQLKVQKKVRSATKSSPPQNVYVSDNETPSTSRTRDRSSRRNSPRTQSTPDSRPTTPSRLTLNKTRRK